MKRIPGETPEIVLTRLVNVFVHDRYAEQLMQFLDLVEKDAARKASTANETTEIYRNQGIYQFVTELKEYIEKISSRGPERRETSSGPALY